MTPTQAKEHHGSITKAAKALGVPYTTFRRKWLGTEAPQKPHDPSQPLTADELRRLIEYNPATGEMIWRVSRGKRRVGAAAGCVCHYGYVVIRIKNRLYRRNRLAWLYVTGSWPMGVVDHRNGTQADDRWVNLRAASPAENARNQKPSVRRTHKSKGVWFDGGPGRRKRWGAKISVDGRQVHLGRFATEEQAHAAYAAAAERYHGAFARTE